MELCKCKKSVIKYTDMSSGKINYTCKGIRNSKASDKLILDEDYPTVFCDYRRHEDIENYKPCIINDKKKEYSPNIISKNKKIESILLKIRHFLSNKLFTTFQELEKECKTFNINFYDKNNETIYEFTQRITKEFSNLI